MLQLRFRRSFQIAKDKTPSFQNAKDKTPADLLVPEYKTVNTVLNSSKYKQLTAFDYNYKYKSKLLY